jgi:hypothetical protein
MGNRSNNDCAFEAISYAIDHPNFESILDFAKEKLI